LYPSKTSATVSIVGVTTPIHRTNRRAELLGALFDRRSDERVAPQSIACRHQ
jgi:hypothetical protein